MRAISAAVFQSTLSVRRATGGAAHPYAQTVISIHALRKESDIARKTRETTITVFQSTLSVRRATSVSFCSSSHLSFQSTLSVRRATFLHQAVDQHQTYFNPRSP